MIRLFFAFFKIGFFAFGGGYGALSLIQDEIVQVNHWLDNQTFLNLISIAQITPGPIAINSATFIGYKLYGIPGSIFATVGVVLPSVFWIYILMKIIKLLSKKMETEKIFTGLRGAIVALILAATLRIGFSSINDIFTVLLAVGAFVILRKFKPSVVWIVLGTGIAGAIFYGFKGI